MLSRIRLIDVILPQVHRQRSRSPESPSEKLGAELSRDECERRALLISKITGHGQGCQDDMVLRFGPWAIYEDITGQISTRSWLAGLSRTGPCVTLCFIPDSN